MAIELVLGRTHDLIADRVVGATDGRWVAIEADSLLTLVVGDDLVELPEAASPRLGDVRFSSDGTLLLAAPHRFDLATRSWIADPFDDRDHGSGDERALDRRLVTSSWAADGLALALVEQTIGGTDQSIVWRRGAMRTRMTGVDHWSAKQCVAITDEPEPQIVVASTLLEVWDPVAATVKWHSEPGRWQIRRLVVTDDSIVTGDAAGNLQTVSIADGQPGWTLDLPHEITGLTTLGENLAIATIGGDVVVLDHEANEIARTTIEVGIVDLASAGPNRLLAAHAAPATGVSELSLVE